MNPTDQARKEQRKRELKKNKKQRQMVRTAVLKGKNPRDIIFELEKVDDMEFNIVSPSPLNEKVLREKRRKLVETWNRVMRMYETDDNAQYLEFKKLWNNYLSRKNEVTQAFEAVKSAENVVLDDIPLPSLIPGQDDSDEEGGAIPLPPSHGMQPKSSILKKPPSVLDSLKPKTCPGVPAGPPPLLSDYLDAGSDSEGEEGESSGDKRRRKIRFEGPPGTEDDVDEATETDVKRGDEKGEKAEGKTGSDKDVDAYMKELEEVHLRQAEKERMQRTLETQPPPPGMGPPPGPPAGMPPPPGRPLGMPMYRPAPPLLRACLPAGARGCLRACVLRAW